MPEPPKRKCQWTTCAELVVSGYCTEHQYHARAKYDKQRGSSTKRGYGYRWQHYSKARLRRFPFCVGFPRDAHADRATLAEHTDHIIPVDGPNDPKFWDERNHQSLCAACHSKKTATEDGGFRGKRENYR